MSRVVQQETWGGSETLAVVERDPRPPLPTEIQVRVHAAGVNPIDLFTRQGAGYMDAISLPFAQGWDVAGVVSAVGYGVNRFTVGDHVFGMPWFPREAGAYADHVTAPALHFAKMPRSTSFDEAAGLPLAGLTAWQMVVDVADVGPGDRVLITGAAGGVGHLAVQIANHRGAEVIALARSKRHEFVRSFGVERVVTTDEVLSDDLLATMDVVIDLIGPEFCLDALRTLKPGGHLVSAQAALVRGLTETAKGLGVRASWYLVEPDGRSLDAIVGLVDAGEMRVYVDHVAPLADAAKAHEMISRREVVGKVVLTTEA